MLDVDASVIVTFVDAAGVTLAAADCGPVPALLTAATVQE
jgi:hypothetical protein